MAMNRAHVKENNNNLTKQSLEYHSAWKRILDKPKESWKQNLNNELEKNWHIIVRNQN